MIKGLEYIRDISCLIAEYYSDKAPLTEEQKLSKNCFLDYCKYIAKELDRLEQIDNANPSEALECVDVLKEDGCITTIYQGKALETINQALIKAQEQEKVLEIIKKKDVNFEVFGAFETYKDYEIYYNNKFHLIENKLTQEEFDLLKRC